MDLDALVTILRSEGADLILRYGSTVYPDSEPADIDLCAVGMENSDRGHFQLGEFDVIRLSWEAFDEYVRRLDPVFCTEPVLEGEPVHDPQNRFPRLQETIRSRSPDSVVIQHHLRRLSEEIQRALRYPQDQVVEPIRYVVSYWLFADWYHADQHPIILRNLIAQHPAEERLQAVFGRAASNTSDSPGNIDSDEAWEIVFELLLGS